MASGGYKGFNIDIPDLLLYGGLAFLAYTWWKTFQKPASDIVETGADVVGAAGNTAESYFNLWTSGFNTAASWFNNLLGNKTDTADTRTNQYSNTGAGIVSFTNPVLSVTEGTTYGQKSSIVKTSKGSTTIFNTPNTYYKDLAIGFNEKGQGYSSAFAGNVAPSSSSTAVKKNTYEALQKSFV